MSCLFYHWTANASRSTKSVGHGQTRADRSKPWPSFQLLRQLCLYRPCKCVHIIKWPNLKLKTRPIQLLGSLPLAFVLPVSALKQIWLLNLSLFSLSQCRQDWIWTLELCIMSRLFYHWTANASSSNNSLEHGQTKVNRTKPVPQFQLLTRPCLYRPCNCTHNKMA